MRDRHDVRTTVAWMRAGTEFLLIVVDELDDADLTRPSALPGWTNAHVVGHLARNAEALGRLATWARTGVETPMYRDGEQRTAEIERSATSPARILRAELAATAERLDVDLEALSRSDWSATVRSALGRAIPAAEIPWMRIREVWLHAVDIRPGAVLADLPAGVLDLLLDDASATLTGKDGCASLTLAPSDRDRTWHLGPTEPERTVTGSAADLAGWITGRTPREDGPVLPRWL